MECGVDFNQDIVASIHDGASVMVKYGRIISAESQCCYSHAIHLSVIETFYNVPKSINPIGADSDSEFSDSDCENDDREFDDVTEGDDRMHFYLPSHYSAIAEMRKIIKFFKKSSLRSEVLQKYVLQKHGKPLKLVLDVKTRWSSLVDAITRFLKLVEPVNKALDELGGNQLITEDNIALLKEIEKTLEPVKLAVLELSKDTSNLLTAEGTLIYVFQQLKKVNTPLAERFKNSLKTRIDQRRNKDLVSLLMFLNNGIYAKSNEFFLYSSKSAIKTLAITLSNRLFPIGNGEEECNSDEDDLNNSIQELEEEVEGQNVLQKCINDLTRTEKDGCNNITLDKELKLLEVYKVIRTNRLERLQKALMTVKPTSVSSERVFSIAGIFISKLRSRLGTATLNALVVLKYYFLNNNRN